MVPCSSCRRHLRASERRCPFCGVDVEAAKVSASAVVGNIGAFALTALVCLGSSACARDQSASDGQTTTTGGTTGDDSSESGSSTATDTSDDSEDTSASSGSFYASGGDIGSLSDCDPWLQDCAEGDKCVPYAAFGGAWNANKCVPIMGDGQPGDPCVSGGLVEATDDCDATSMCWNTQEVDGEQVGVCTAFCEGTPDNPSCAEGTACMVANDEVLTLCVELCDPFAQDCGEGQGCFWIVDLFTCANALADAALGDLCGGVNHCPPGAACVEECLGGACCLEFCSIIEPDCAGPLAECVPFFEEAPPNYEDVGLCISPSCDPLGQDCPDGLACYWMTSDFTCEPPGTAALGEPCEVSSDCADPSICVQAASLPDCAGAHCCAAFCSVTEPSCAQPGTECDALFEDVGACVEP